MSGLYQLYRLRELGMRVRVFEAGTNVGGTWYWNRYPGARFDSESYSYGYSFSSELLKEWDWSEHFAGQPETLRYLNHVADKFDLRRDIEFRSRVTAATYEEDTRSWNLTLEDGRHFRTRFLVTAIGPLSTPTLPRIEGRDSFAGQSFHTARWPHEPVDFTGKRVAVIGTGASAIQTVPQIQPIVEHIDVFQRTPPWVMPHRDRPITEAERRIYRRFPALQRIVRSWGYFTREMLVPGFVRNPQLMKLPQRVARRNLERNVADPELRAKLMPDYWEPIFAISKEKQFSRSTLYAIGCAFTENHPYRVLAGGLRKAIVAEFRAGKQKAFNSLVGQVMKASKGKANPAEVNAALLRKLAT